MRLIKIAALLALAYVAYYVYQSHYSPQNELIGHWQSHKGKSMRFFQRGGLTQSQESVFNAMLGKMRVEVTESEWITTMDGRVNRYSYSINSRDGDCYQLRLASNEARYACLVDGDMHVPGAWRNATEVFVRVPAPQE